MCQHCYQHCFLYNIILVVHRNPEHFWAYRSTGNYQLHTLSADETRKIRGKFVGKRPLRQLQVMIVHYPYEVTPHLDWAKAKILGYAYLDDMEDMNADEITHYGYEFEEDTEPFVPPHLYLPRQLQLSETLLPH